MKKLIVGIIIAFCSPVHVCAQHLKVVNANKQDWSGGVAGHYGSNYSITLTPITTGVQFDSLYVNGFGVKLGQGPNENVRTDTLHHNYNIFAGESHDDGEYGHNPTWNTKPVASLPVRRFNGAALILYEYKGKHYSLTVKQFQELEPLAYP